MSLSDDTLRALNQPAKGVEQRRGAHNRLLDYLPVGQAIDNANEIFGNGGWCSEIACTTQESCVQENIYHVVTYSAHVTVFPTDGKDKCSRSDVGVGTGKSIHLCDAIEMAIKTAVSDGIKRAMRQFGRALGGNMGSSRLVVPLRLQKRKRDLTEGEAQEVEDAANDARFLFDSTQ